MSEVLPYLEVEQGNLNEVEERSKITTPDITGKTIEEAQKIIKESELDLKINNEYEGMDKSNTIISNQLPQAGIEIYSKSCIYVDF